MKTRGGLVNGWNRPLANGREPRSAGRTATPASRESRRNGARWSVYELLKLGATRMTLVDGEPAHRDQMHQPYEPRDDPGFVVGACG